MESPGERMKEACERAAKAFERLADTLKQLKPRYYAQQGSKYHK